VHYLSTRGGVRPASLSEAILGGAAPDRGLFVPATLPREEVRAPPVGSPLPVAAHALLSPFFAGDALEGHLDALCQEAFSFPAPLRPLVSPEDLIVELFHGPTAAFKDYGARFLAACLRRLRPEGSSPLTILVATSGDTGSAVAAAFHRAPGVRVVLLYPDGRVSPRQAHQLGCFGENVLALRVAGSFDDCQAMVKAAFLDPGLRQRLRLTSANSISLGRLLPQMAYHAHAAWGATVPLNLVVPTGNLGNALAAVWARELGAPIGEIVLATNANRVLCDFFAGGDYSPRPSVATLANAMDVGAPSNFERLVWTVPEVAVLRQRLRAMSVGDEEIRETIRRGEREHGQLFCPHTATAVHALGRLRAEGARGRWAVVATAHPAKFETVVEPLIGHPVPVPAPLATLLERPARAEPLAAEPEALRRWLLQAAAG
jgi:threonine synthase